MSMMNIDSVTAHLSKMSPQQLQQFASIHMDDPLMLAAAKFVSNQQTKMQQSQQPAPGVPPKVNEQVVASIAPQQMPQQQMPQQQQPQQQMPPQAQGLPEDSGIAQLPARNMQGMAEGGIVAFARGGDTGENTTAAYRGYALQRAQEMGIDPTFADSIFNIESGYRPNAVSPTGPVGVGQLTKKTGEYYGVSPEERKDPYKNIDASLAFMSDLQRKYKGDPEKMAVAYNQGESVLNKHLRENAGELNPAQLKPEAQGYLNKLGKFMTAAVPIGTAQAAPVPVPGKQPPAGIPSDITAGAGGKALMAGTGLAAIPAAASALRAPSMAVGPATAAGGAGGPGTALQTAASRLSPYVRPASMGPAGPVIAGGAALATGAANALSNATPEQLAQLQGDIGSDTGLAAAIMNPANRGPQAPVSPTLAAARKAQAQDNTPSDTVYDPMTGIPMYGTETTTGDDRTFRERLGLGNVANRKALEEMERTLRLKNLPPTKAGAGRGAVNPPMATPEYEPEDLPKAAQKEVIATAKENVPEGTNTKGFTNEDWLNLGFGLLAGKSQYAMQNLGEAGIATLAARQARIKSGLEERKAGIDERKATADIAQSGAMSKYYTAAAERYAAEDKPLAQARKELAAAYAKLETDTLLKLDPVKMAEAKRLASAEIMARYPELGDTMGLGSAGPALDLSKWGQPAKQ